MRWLRRHRGVAAGVVLSVATAIGAYYGLGPSGPILKSSYKTFSGDSSTANLPTAITINAQAISPTYRYYAQDCDATKCTASIGDDLLLTAVGADPSVELPTPFTAASDKAVGAFTADYYTALTGDWAAEDGILSLTFRATGTTNATLLHHHDGTHGYRVYVNASDQLVFEADGSSALVSIVSSALTPKAWYHAELYYDASGSAQWYVNATASGSAIAVSGVGSLTAPTANLSFGSDAVNHWDGQVAFVALHLQSAWLDTHLQSTVAEERFYRLTGLYPQVSADATITYARTTTAYLRSEQTGIDATLFLVGAQWPRVEKVDGIVGYFAEPERTNGLKYSEDWTSGVWNKAGVTSIGDDAVAPDGQTTADRLTYSTPTQETYQNAVNFNAGASVDGLDAAWCLWLKRVSGGTQLWIGTTDAATWSGQTQTKITLTDSWTRYCGVHLINSPTAKATVSLVIGTNHQVTPGTDDLPPITMHAWGAQIENASLWSSYIPTTSGNATRIADTLNIPASTGNAGNGSPNRLQVQHVLRVDDVDHSGGVIWSISDDTSNDALTLSIENSDVLRLQSSHLAGDAGDVTGMTDIADGARHAVKALVQNGKLTLYVDGNLEGTDATVSMPDGLVSIDIGHAWDDLGQPIANIGNFQVGVQ